MAHTRTRLSRAHVQAAAGCHAPAAADEHMEVCCTSHPQSSVPTFSLQQHGSGGWDSPPTKAAACTGAGCNSAAPLHAASSSGHGSTHQRQHPSLIHSALSHVARHLTRATARPLLLASLSTSTLSQGTAALSAADANGSHSTLNKPRFSLSPASPSQQQQQQQQRFNSPSGAAPSTASPPGAQQPSTAGGAGAGAGGFLRSFQLSAVPRLVGTLLGVSPEFIASQTAAEHVYRFHMLHNGLFPRPCPHCGDRQFLVPAAELERQRREAAQADRAARSARRRTAPGGSKLNSNSNSSSASAQGSAATDAAGNPGVAADSVGPVGSFPAGPSLADGSGVAPVAFQSRPLVCEQCQRWSHFGCVGIHCVEDVPSRPWFHCKGCRDAYVRMEALKGRGEMLIPSSVSSPSGALTFTFSTPSDLAAFLARVQDEVLNPDGRGVGGVRRRRVAPGSDMLAVFELLSNSKQGVDRQVAERLMDASSEFDAGRYALLLRRGGDPIATATFNVLGPGLPAQVNLVAAADGFHEPLFQVLESALGTELGVGSVVTQPQPGLSAKQAARLGYRPLTPADAADLHLVMPVAFLDAPMLGKTLL